MILSPIWGRSRANLGLTWGRLAVLASILASIWARSGGDWVDLGSTKRKKERKDNKNNVARHAEEDHSSRDKEERRTDEKIDRRDDENARPTFSRREERTRADWNERPNVVLAISMERRPYE